MLFFIGLLARCKELNFKKLERRLQIVSKIPSSSGPLKAHPPQYVQYRRRKSRRSSLIKLERFKAGNSPKRASAPYNFDLCHLDIAFGEEASFGFLWEYIDYV